MLGTLALIYDIPVLLALKCSALPASEQMKQVGQIHDITEDVKSEPRLTETLNSPKEIGLHTQDTPRSSGEEG